MASCTFIYSPKTGRHMAYAPLEMSYARSSCDGVLTPVLSYITHHITPYTFLWIHTDNRRLILLLPTVIHLPVALLSVSSYVATIAVIAATSFALLTPRTWFPLTNMLVSTLMVFLREPVTSAGAHTSVGKRLAPTA